MALPVIDSIVFDKATYAPAEAIHVTINYHGSNTRLQSFVFNGSVVDLGTNETGDAQANFFITHANILNASASDAGLRTWTLISDDHKGIAIFSAVA